MVVSVNMVETEIPKKLRDDLIYLIKTFNMGWYRVYRQSEKIWMAVCVVPTTLPKYLSGDAKVFRGNSMNVLDEMIVSQIYKMQHESQYRKCLMAIMASGEINGKFEFTQTPKGD